MIRARATVFAMGLIDRLKRKWWRLQRKVKGSAKSPRQDIVTFEIQPDAVINVYWKDVRGPGAALFIYGSEVLRFDCFGETGHYHQHPLDKPFGREGENRLHFKDKATEAQIEQTIFELTRNVRYHVQRSKDPKIQHFKLDMDSLAEQLPLVRDRMMQHVRNRREAAAAAASVPGEFVRSGQT